MEQDENEPNEESSVQGAPPDFGAVMLIEDVSPLIQLSGSMDGIDTIALVAKKRDATKSETMSKRIKLSDEWRYRVGQALSLWAPSKSRNGPLWRPLFRSEWALWEFRRPNSQNGLPKWTHFSWFAPPPPLII